MKHLFLPYKLALLAKEKGFDESCFTWYYNVSKRLAHGAYSSDGISNRILELIGYSKTRTAAPLYQQIIDWFREKHKLHIHLESCADDKFFYVIEDISEKGYIRKDGYKRFMPRMMINSDEFDSHILCYNTAIEEAFKLI